MGETEFRQAVLALLERIAAALEGMQVQAVPR